MDAQAVIGYTGVVALLTITPGLDMALVSQSALSGGRGAALATTAGIVCGLLAWGCASAIGVAAVLAASWSAYDALRLAGAAYLVWLGALSLHRARRAGAESRPTLSRSTSRAFRMGLFTNLANPKIAVFYSTVLPTFIPADAGVLPWSLALAGIHAVLSLVWLTAYAWLLTRARALLVRGPARRALEALTGVVLIGFGIRLALSRG
jgi:threonine/homoserine/homoserine lactone efflux protein